MKYPHQPLLPLLALPIIFIGGCSTPTSPNAAPTDASTTSTAVPTASDVSFDQQFIDSMVPHHESAVMMAKMVVTRAQFPEVRVLAKAIIADQDREIAQMKSWRKAWFGSDAVPPMSGHGGMEQSSMDHAQMDHAQMDHAQMDHAQMDHAQMDHAQMDHAQMDHGAMSDVMTMPGSAMGLPITGAMDMKKLREAKGSEVDREFLRMMVPHHANAIVMAQEVLLQSKRPELQKLARQIVAAQAREVGEMEAIARKRFGAL